MPSCIRLTISIVALPCIGCSSSESMSPTHDAGRREDARVFDALHADSGSFDATVPAPTASGQVTGGAHGIPFNSMPAALADRYGYSEEEYFAAGIARAFGSVGTWSSDGRWDVVPISKANYKTRLIVRTPKDATKFNGTVVVEWLNVSAGVDADADFGEGYPELLRDGFGYVGVSAQVVGVEGGPGIVPVGIPVQALKQWDPERYGSLSHPGDDYSYDIYAQVADLLRHPGAVDPLRGLSPKRLIGDGESQSAFRMVTFVDAIQPLTQVFDGFFIHSRAAGGAPLSKGSAAPVPPSVFIRDDLSVPVFQFQTETDLFLLGFYPARQPNTDRVMTWEVAGTAHADQAQLDYGASSSLLAGIDAGGRGTSDASANPADAGSGGFLGCGSINRGPQTYVERQALFSLEVWMRAGTLPSAADPLQITDSGTKIARDARGNALGGVRTPVVDVPTAAYSGDPKPGGGLLCALFGSTTAFDTATLLSLYPTHQDYVDAFTASASAAVSAGHLLPADSALLVADAKNARVP